MNQQDDDNYGYQEQEDYGQDYYEEEGQEGFEAEGEYTEEAYDDSQLPVQERRSFFQRYSSLIIYGGIGIVIVVMGYINFGHLLFPPQSAEQPLTADQLLTPDYIAPAEGQPQQDATVIPPADDGMGAAPVDGSAPVVPPEMNAMGVSPAAPVTGAVTDGGIALSPVAPSSSSDPWAEVATAPPAPIEAAPAAPTPVAPTVPAADMTAPAATASVGDAVAVPSAEAAKLAETQKKLEEAEAIRKEQEAAIAELQNRLAEAEAKAVAAPAKTETTRAEPVEPAQPKPKKAAAAKPAAPKPVTSSWELRSASEGMAWVTRRGDNQLFRVGVGDEVPGIGRVTAIREQDGRWVVVGTEGQIRQ